MIQKFFLFFSFILRLLNGLMGHVYYVFHVGWALIMSGEGDVSCLKIITSWLAREFFISIRLALVLFYGRKYYSCSYFNQLRVKPILTLFEILPSPCQGSASGI